MEARATMAKRGRLVGSAQTRAGMSFWIRYSSACFFGHRTDGRGVGVFLRLSVRDARIAQIRLDGRQEVAVERHGKPFGSGMQDLGGSVRFRRVFEHHGVSEARRA
jgi:hypothetical protein